MTTVLPREPDHINSGVCWSFQALESLSAIAEGNSFYVLIIASLAEVL